MLAAVSATPANAARLRPRRRRSGRRRLRRPVDGDHAPATGRAADRPRSCATSAAEMPIPVVVGNCVAFSAALELMETGIAGLLVGRRAGRGLHQPRGARRRRAAGDRHDRLRARPATRYYRAHRPLRADHHRRRHADRRRRLQGDRLRRRRGDARLAVRADAPRRPGEATTGAWRRRTARCRAARGSRSASGHAGADAVRADLAHRRHPEPDGRAPHLHGRAAARRHRARCTTSRW